MSTEEEMTASVTTIPEAAASASKTAGEEAGNTAVPPPPVASQKLVKLPMSRVKALMKSDPDVSLASQEAVFIISKATELFIETIAKDAYVYAQRGKRKTLQRKDLDNTIDAFDELAFLEGTLD
ncbi:DNA polymerase epsilon subunit 4 isoform X2 [Rhinoderma darwinii]|uniref:DNA polymerase epsilon subunit 4 isoform X2 n=1 Tax=Rhinoderma darwinii TaxID=43563 RepID=UPI003F668D31